eukprot:SAG11_NODE_5225_length_1624_cov_3.860984_2_plen_146_part_00
MRAVDKRARGVHTKALQDTLYQRIEERPIELHSLPRQAPQQTFLRATQAPPQTQPPQQQSLHLSQNTGRLLKCDGAMLLRLLALLLAQAEQESLLCIQNSNIPLLHTRLRVSSSEIRIVENERDFVAILHHSLPVHDIHPLNIDR